MSLYKTYNDYYLNQNAVGTGLTDANGGYLFSGLPIYNYYYKFSGVCGNMVGGNSDNYQITGSISEGSTYLQDVTMSYL